jgi:acyl carrier protein
VVEATRVRDEVLRALRQVAPEVDTSSLAPAVAFRDQVDLDSVDYLNFALELEKRLGVPIPDADYPLLASLQGCLDYFARR